MSQEDLDVVMMEDFGPDIDLLDDLLGLDSTIDWCKLEPSLSMSFEPQSPESPLGPELPSLPMLGSIGATSPEPSHQHHHPPPRPQLSPQAQEVPPLTVTASSPLQTRALLTGGNAGLNALSQHQIHFTTTTTTPFTGFGIPFSPAMFGNAVLLPQLQLTVVDNQAQSGKKSSKLPVKRLEKGSGAPRKKEPTNRRSSHNAIERRYRSSINDKILELKNLVCAPSEPNEKVHKAAILRSSIESIRHLQSTNSRLDKENRDLKKSMAQCPTCRNDTSLRAILTASASSPATPPPTESESTDSSNPPSPNEDIKPGTKGLLAKSPLLLFSLVTGLFLINPIAHHNQSEVGLTHRSRVERSVGGEFHENVSTDLDWHAVWAPRIITILVNLFLFSVLYWMSGRVGHRSSRGKYSTEQLRLLRGKEWAKASSTRNKSLHIQTLLSQFETLPGNSLSRFLATLVNLGRMPFALRRSTVKDAEVREELSLLYLEWGACGGEGVFPCLRAINLSSTNKQIILRSLIQAKSKLLLKFLLLWTDLSTDRTFGTPEGLFFLQNHVARGPGSTDFLTNQLDELGQMTGKFREDALGIGMEELLLRGGGRHLFRLVLTSAKKDQLAQFWAAIMWTEAEWISGGGRSETVKRLCRLVDSLWRSLKEREERGLLTAIYKAHLGKRALMTDGVPDKYTLDEASSCLRDSINTATEKPRRLRQLAWCLGAEWILECRLSLWEEHKDGRGFSKDLDTLRSLTHFVPGVLPSVYLYEASQRLMNYAAPGRTQQLLDASLREVRMTSRVLLCKDSRDFDSAASGSKEDGVACHLGKRRKEPNLVREKRKAFALYLKCKYLPNQVITCPAEKAGMLKEALQALEKVGQKKKIQACLEMIRALGQSITLH